MSGSPPNPRDPYLRLHAVNVYVRNQERSLRFYLDQLGFDLAFDGRLPSGDRWVAVAPSDGGAVLSLIAPAPTSKEYKLIGRATQAYSSPKTWPPSFESGASAECASGTRRASGASTTIRE